MMDELLAEVRKHDRAEVSYKTGVSLSTLNTLLSGANSNPKISTLNKLQKFLDDKAKEQSNVTTGKGN
jgi:predicted transcriptional regulator